MVSTMMKLSLATALVAALFSTCLSASATPSTASDEGQLRDRLEQTLWPADIVRVASDYLRAYPQGQAAPAAREMLSGAESAMRALQRNDVHLYRTAFRENVAPNADAQSVKEDMRRAALGDPAAAMRLAHRHQRGEGGLAADLNRYVGWLQLASVLGDEHASYELALYFRKENQPVLAAEYEARAQELGFELPTVLDHVRK